MFPLHDSRWKDYAEMWANLAQFPGELLVMNPPAVERTSISSNETYIHGDFCVVLVAVL